MPNTEKIKVLIIENSFDVTGAFKSIFGLTKNITGEFEFHYVIRKNSKLRSVLMAEEVQFIEIPFLEIGKTWKIIFYVPMLLFNSWRLTRYIRQYQIHIVHMNDLYNMTGVILKIFNRNLKLIYHVRLLPNSYAGKLYNHWLRLINRWADYCIVVSAAVEESIKGIVQKPYKIIYDFVPLENQDEHLKQPNKVVEFVYPANYSKGKGQEFALQAFAEVYRAHKDISLTFYGSEAGSKKNVLFKKSLLKMSNKLGIESKVFFRSGTDNIEKVMKEADVVLMFSESESFSLICYEALFYGRTIIATDCGGPRELIEDGRNGLLVYVRDLKSMVDKMNAVIASPTLRKKLSEQAYSDIRSKVSHHNAENRLAGVYRQIL